MCLILTMWHFSDDEGVSFAKDRLKKLTRFPTLLVEKFQMFFTASLQVCVDETMVPFRERLRLRQYIKTRNTSLV